MQEFNSEQIHQIVIRGLRFRTKVNDIYDAFKEFGEIAACRLIVNERNESKGYCFIVFKNKFDADRSIQAMSGLRFDGAVINVSYAKDQRMGEEMIERVNEKNQRRTNNFNEGNEIRNFQGIGKKIQDEARMNQQNQIIQQNQFYQSDNYMNYSNQFQNNYTYQNNNYNNNQHSAYRKDSYDYNNYNNIKSNNIYYSNQQYYENNWNNPNNIYNNNNYYYQRQ